MVTKHQTDLMTADFSEFSFPKFHEIRNSPAPVKEPKRKNKPSRETPTPPVREPIVPAPRKNPAKEAAPGRQPSTCPMPK